MSLYRRNVRETTHVWLSVFILIALSAYWLAIHLVYRLKFLADLFDQNPKATYLADILFLWILVLLWVAYRRWRRALERKEELDSILSSITPNVLLVITPNRTIVDCNKSTERMFGYTPEEVIGQKTEWLYADRRGKDETRIGSSLSQIGFHVGPAVGRHRSGDNIPLEILSARMQDNSGAVLLLQDVTERQQAEQRNRQLEAQLRRSQKMEAIGRLAGGVAHDFNNILQGAYMSVEMVNDSLPEGGDQREDLDTAMRLMMRGRDLVKQILSFSRMDEEEHRPIHVPPIVSEAVQMMRSTLPAAIEIESDIDLRCRMVAGNASQIHQIIVNLGVNAGAAIDEGGGRITIVLVDTALDADAADALELPPGPYLRLSVADDGCGIPDDVQDNIFEPFFTTKPPGAGSGMGLAVLHGIVESHGGTVHVKSTVGEGTQFDIYLPITNAPAVTAPVTPDPNRIPGAKVLAVDDEVELLNVVKVMLERRGYEVTATTNTHEALSVFTQNPSRFDLALLDQTMPKQTGLDLATELMKRRANFPVIIMTGYSDDVTPARLTETGIRGLLMKTFSATEADQAIQEVLRGGSQIPLP